MDSSELEALFRGFAEGLVADARGEVLEGGRELHSRDISERSKPEEYTKNR